MSPERLTQPKKYFFLLSKPTLHYSPPKKKKGVSVLPAKRSLYRIYRDNIPVEEGEKKTQKIGLASVHVHPAIIPSWAARTMSIPAVKPLPSSWRNSDRCSPVVPPQSRGIQLLLRHGADKILRFLRGIVASLFPYVPCLNYRRIDEEGLETKRCHLLQNQTKCLSPDRCSWTKVGKAFQCDIVLCAFHRISLPSTF